jgi:L-seryl-tRNA(Ser) seleniumtransferase
MLSATADSIRIRCHAIANDLARAGIKATVVASEASVGAGAFPTTPVPSFALSFEDDAVVVERRLRLGEFPVIGRITDGALLLDLRSVPARDDDLLRRSIEIALA